MRLLRLYSGLRKGCLGNLGQDKAFTKGHLAGWKYGEHREETRCSHATDEIRQSLRSKVMGEPRGTLYGYNQGCLTAEKLSVT